MNKIVSAFLSLFISLSGFSQQSYTPVDAESKIHFTTRNFAIKTGGDFTGLQGKIIFDAARLPDTKFEVSVNTATIDTDSEMRDGHLKGPDYFDVIKYPAILFSSTVVTPTAKSGVYHMQGNLTIKGTTRMVQFDFSAVPQPGGYVFKGEFEIDRLDYKVGGKSISLQDKVKIELKVVAKK